MNWHFVENILVNLSFGLLLASLLSYWINLAYTQIKQFNSLGKFCIIGTNICLFINLLARWIINQYFPLSNLYESLLFLTWCLTFAQILLEYKNKNIIIGTINAPICLFIISFASFSLPIDMQQASPLVPALRSNWLIMHVTIMMVSYATLMLGSLLSILFLVLTESNIGKKNIKKLKEQNNHQHILVINNHHNIAKITLLESIDNLSYRTIGLGFPLLTIGIIAGAVWANEAWGSYWSWDPKETWALITWLIFAAYLHSRLTKSWSGKKPAILASIGFLVVWICYLGVNFLGKGLHSYGWLQ
jgi:cytochrome c-type biogenesis protein CcsB